MFERIEKLKQLTSSSVLWYEILAIDGDCIQITAVPLTKSGNQLHGNDAIKHNTPNQLQVNDTYKTCFHNRSSEASCRRDSSDQLFSPE